MPVKASLNPKRTVAELKELRGLTGDENGAQRVAFTRTWLAARAWLRQKLEALPVEIHNDAAGNTWATLRGQSDRALLIGGHIDSVPNGGWLDGCLNVLAGVEVLRRINAQFSGHPPVTVRLVDLDAGQIIVEGGPVSLNRQARVTEAGDYRFFAGWPHKRLGVCGSGPARDTTGRSKRRRQSR